MIRIAVTLLLLHRVFPFNDSVCGAFKYGGVYYNVNDKYTNEDVIGNNYVMNYCEELEYLCPSTYTVMTGSYIRRTGQGCLSYKQNQIKLIDSRNISSGITINYKLISIPLSNQTESTVSFNFPCKESGVGCPFVQKSTIFTYFESKELGYTITCEVVGVIFMVLGVYIYRITTVLVGAFSMFIILLAIEVPIIFYPGVPHSLISNVLIVSGICSFFAGYVIGYFPKVGLFCLGGWIGIIISLTLNNIAFYLIPSEPANLTLWIVMPILCVIFGVMSLFIKKTFIIFATSLIGAYLCLRALSWHLGAFPNEFLLARRYHLGLCGPVPWQFYLYVIALIILTISSSALQFWLFTKHKKLHQESGNIDDDFGNLEEEMKKKRENFVDFQGIFKNPAKKLKNLSRPKKLKKDQYSDNDSEDLSDDNHEKDDPSEKQSEDGPQLKKKLIVK